MDDKPAAPGLSEGQGRPSAAVAGETWFGPSQSVSPHTGSPARGGLLRQARPLAAPEAGEGDEQPEETSGLRLPPFLLGAAAALGAHEGGHLLFSKVFGAQVGVSRVSFHGVPFFAVTHTPVSRRREFVVSSGGFWVQHALSEIILSREPDLRRRSGSFSKGVLAFDVLASTAYAGAAFSRTGPSQRDTRSMGASLGLDERWVGLMVLVPAVLDAYRYLNPDAAWAKWTSRGMKIGMVGLTLR